MNFSRLLRVGATLAFLTALPLAAQSTSTWTGSASSDWGDPANWTNGVPDATVDAVVPNVGVPPLVLGTFLCSDLTVAAGSVLTIGSSNPFAVGQLTVRGDAAIAGRVEGAFSIDDDPGVPVRPLHQLVCQGSGSLASVQAGVGVVLDCTDLRADSFSTMSSGGISGTVRWLGTTRLGSAYCLGAPQGTIHCPSDASLEITGFFDLAWNFHPPVDCSIAVLRMGPTSSVTPTGGTIRVPPQKSLAVDCSSYGALQLQVDVPATASFRVTDTQPSAPNSFSFPQCEGSLTVMSADPCTLAVGPVRGALHVSVVDGDLVSSSGGPLQVAPGGSLTLAYPVLFSGSVRTRGPVEVDGDLVIAGPFALELADDVSGAHGRLHVRAGGRLQMLGAFSPGSPPVLQGAANRQSSVLVDGRFEAQWYRIQGLGPAGFELGPSSMLGSAPLDLAFGWFDDGDPSPGSSLLRVSRSTPTLLHDVNFDATNTQAPVSIDASSATAAVDVRRSFGVLASEVHERDPRAVVSWLDGVSYEAAPTPGCLGLAEYRANRTPRVGDAGFATSVQNALPGSFSVHAIGFGLAASPYPFLGVSVVLDPTAPIQVAFQGVSPTGVSVLPLPIPNDPYFAGVAFWGTALVAEATGCMPFDVSASTTIRMTIRP